MLSKAPHTLEGRGFFLCQRMIRSSNKMTNFLFLSPFFSVFCDPCPCHGSILHSLSVSCVYETSHSVHFLSSSLSLGSSLVSSPSPDSFLVSLLYLDLYLVCPSFLDSSLVSDHDSSLVFPEDVLNHQKEFFWTPFPWKSFQFWERKKAWNDEIDGGIWSPNLNSK